MNIPVDQQQEPAQATCKACGEEQDSFALFSGADVISVYTRAQAIADGCLIDVTKTASEAGFRVPVAITSAAWADCVAWTDENTAQRPGLGQTEGGRLWDVVWMAANAAKAAAKRQPGTQSILFEVYRVPATGRGISAKRAQLRLHSGPGDNAEHVMTITCPNED